MFSGSGGEWRSERSANAPEGEAGVIIFSHGLSMKFCQLWPFIRTRLACGVENLIS